MADQRPAFRFRLPWLPSAPPPPPPPRPAVAPRLPPQATSSTTPAPTPFQRTTASENPAPNSQSTSTKTPTPNPQKVDTETPTQSPQTKQAQALIQSTTTAIPSSTASQKDEIRAPGPSVATITPAPANTEIAQTATTQSKEAPAPSINAAIPTSTTPTMTSIPENTQTSQNEPPSQSTTPTPPNTETAQNQPSRQSAAIATANSKTPERPPPFKPRGAISPQTPFPEPQASRTKSQPTSPSRITSQSRVPSQSASPSRLTTQSRSSQLSTPFRAASQSQATSPLSSPSRKGAPNSPAPQTPSSPQSRIASRSAGQTPSTSPSRKGAQGQLTTATLTQSTSPPKREPRLSPERFQPSSNSTENPSSLLEQEKKSSEQHSLERFQPKEETKSGNVYDSQEKPPFETSTEPSEVARQPLEKFGMRTTTTFRPTRDPQTSAPTPKSDARNSSRGPENFPEDSKPEETKEVKEIMQKIKERTYKEARDNDHYLLRSVPGMAGAKEQAGFTYQSQQDQQNIDRKEMKETHASNGKETKTPAQPRNKTTSVESHKKLATTNGEHIPKHKEIWGDISKLVQKMAGGDSKHSVTDRPVGVITLTGENRGATMHLGTESMKGGVVVPIRRGYKLNPDESAETTTDGEGSSKVKSEDAQDTEDLAAEEFINSNVQGINNSIVFNSSITEKKPGVHLVHSRFPTKVMTSTAETEIPDTEKKAFSTSHAQKVTYQLPMVRRRCLRGLLMESSDSDPENSTKPRRHGCRVGSKDKSEEKKG